MKYVQRRANRFEFRFLLPDDVAGQPYPLPWPESLVWCVNERTGRFKTELIRSLKTSDAKAAERAALPLIAEAHRLVDHARQALRSGPPTEIAPNLIAELAKEHEIRLLQNDEALRRRGVGLNLRRGRIESDGLGMSDDDIGLYQRAVAELDEHTRAEAAKMRGGEALQLSLNRAVEERGIILHPDDPAWRELEMAFIKAQRSALDSIQARLKGETVATPELPKQAAIAASPRDTLSGALHRWSTGGGKAARKPRENSIAEAERAVQQFIELHGDLELQAITKAHARQFRDALAQVPKALPRAIAKLRLPEILKRDLSKYPKRNAQTVNKNLHLIAGIMAKAEKDGFFEELPSWSNPFHVGFDIAPAEREPYEPFSLDDLNRLFASPVFAQNKRPTGGQGEAAFWFPLIALFTGARRTEIAQLRVGDIRESGGIFFIDFNDEGEDQNLKNASSARSVPIHAELLKSGFMDYVAMQATSAAPATLLWPGFETPIAAKARAWSKWFGRYLGPHAVDHPAKTFHSFRHTFKRACREAGISEEMHHAFTGHSGGGVGRSYGRLRRSDGTMDRGVSLTRLKLEIDKVSYPGLIVPAWSSANRVTGNSA
ncbi:MAG TPA: site-specific integrase [Mesorhizobium sp.]|jgi:integrase|nr:site-specific integrase [Mesorhizobium sp.]